MTDQAGTASPTARELLERAQQLFLKKDLNSFADMFTEDGIHELPFAPPGVPVTIQGREKIREYFSLITVTPIEFHEFVDLTIYEATDPNVVIAEYTAKGVIVSSGEPYTTRYIQVLQARDGEVAVWRDYWNPLSGATAMGRLPQLFKALTGQDLS
ncbi:MAG TPA: nuclear transport factor 2 family protein [Pseudonocardiaceae bacterium]|jgi:ketosteroid isomerase-like protein|nr:nuclear transport factor 2 family protein [Pseudonocardiaceae bacterium]